jgi:hypothetical protein
LAFCKDYGHDRIWMKSVGVDVSEMPEEKRFLMAMKKYNFKDRRRIVENTLKVKTMLKSHNIERLKLENHLKKTYKEPEAASEPLNDKPDPDNEPIRPEGIRHIG